MKPYYIWTFRLWFWEICWKRDGNKKFKFEYLRKNSFVGKRGVAFFKEGKKVF